jgi:hypothetical protein
MYKEIKKIEFDYPDYPYFQILDMNENKIFLSNRVDYKCINIDTKEVLFENIKNHDFEGNYIVSKDFKFFLSEDGYVIRTDNPKDAYVKLIDLEYKLAISNDSKKIAGFNCKNDTLYIFDSDSLQVIQKINLQKGSYGYIRFSADDKYIYWDGEYIFKISLEKGEIVQKYESYFSSTNLACSKNGKYLANCLNKYSNGTSTTEFNKKYGQKRMDQPIGHLFNAVTGEFIYCIGDRVFDDHPEYFHFSEWEIERIEFTNDSEYMLITPTDQNVTYIVDVETGRIVSLLYGITQYCLSDDDKYITIFESNCFRVYERQKDFKKKFLSFSQSQDIYYHTKPSFYTPHWTEYGTRNYNN